MTFTTRELRRSDTASSSALHHDVLGMEFLARAGERFLRSYHQAWIDSPYALALATVDEDGVVVGVLLGSAQPAEHYRTMVRRHGPVLMLRLLVAAVSHPRFAQELFATRLLRYARGVTRTLARARPTGPPREPAAGTAGAAADDVGDPPGGADGHLVGGSPAAGASVVGEVTHVMVSRDVQSHGVGRMLLDEVSRAASAAGVDRLELVTPPDLAARGFYEHLGWQRAGQLTSRSGEAFLRYQLTIERPGPDPASAPAPGDAADAADAGDPGRHFMPASGRHGTMKGMSRSPAQLQRWVWDRRASTWDHDGSAGLERVVEAVVRAAAPQPGAVAVDLGCGTGQVSLVLAKAGAQVIAVDVSPEMIDRLEAKAERDGIEGITGVVASMEEFRLESGSVDLVVSNYALHHLRDSDKQELVRAATEWLRPGGKLVVGDMMFGRGLNAHDRSIIASKVAVLARRGPAGWWRVMKNVARFGLRVQERPVSIDRWTQYFEEVGLADVTATPVVAEAAVVVGTKPA